MTRPPNSYAAAQEELEAILAELQQPDSPLDVLVEKVARARALITWSREALRDTEREVDALLEETDA